LFSSLFPDPGISYELAMEKMSTLETGILRKLFSISDRNAAEVTPRPRGTGKLLAKQETASLIQARPENGLETSKHIEA
jgi:hypothetical protein